MRLRDYDYSQNGAYFITICAKDRKGILGTIVGEAAFGVPIVELTKIGETVKSRIEHINDVPNMQVDKYVIMPNHLHLLITLTDGTPRAASPTKATIPQIVNTIKSLTSKNVGASIWQRSYHDHVIRNDAEYRSIWQYIDENPARWSEDIYYVKKDDN